MIGDLWDPEESRAWLEAVAASPRYRGVRVCGYRAVSLSLIHIFSHRHPIGAAV